MGASHALQESTNRNHTTPGYPRVTDRNCGTSAYGYILHSEHRNVKKSGIMGFPWKWCGLLCLMSLIQIATATTVTFPVEKDRQYYETKANGWYNGNDNCFYREIQGGGWQTCLWANAFDIPVSQIAQVQAGEDTTITCRKKVTSYAYSYAGYPKYLCRSPCRWADVLPRRPEMQFKDNPVDRNRLDIVLRGRWEKTLTSGRYQCCIEKSGKDYCAPLEVKVLPPVRKEERSLQDRLRDVERENAEEINVLEDIFPSRPSF